MATISNRILWAFFPFAVLSWVEPQPDTAPRGAAVADVESRSPWATAELASDDREKLKPRDWFDRLRLHPDEREQNLAVGCLREIGSKASDLIPELVELSKSSKPRERMRAIDVLGNVARRDATVRQLLFESTRDPDKDVRVTAVDALSRFAPTQCVLEVLRESNDEATRTAVYRNLESRGESSVARRFYQRSMADEKASTRRWAVGQAAKCVNDYPELIPALAATADDPEITIRCDVVMALGRLDKTNNQVVSALTKRLRDEDRSIRWQAAKLLCEMDQPPRDVVPALKELFKDPAFGITENSSAERLLLARYLYMNDGAEAALDYIIQQARGADMSAAYLAVKELSNLCGRSERAWKALEETLASPSFWQNVKQSTLEITSGESAIPLLRRRLASDDKHHRSEAYYEIRQLGERAKELAPDVARAVTKETDVELKDMATRALNRANEHAETAVKRREAIRRDLRNDDTISRALDEIRQWKPDAREYVDDLAPVVGTFYYPNRMAALHILVKLGPLARSALPSLRSRLGDETPWYRAEVGTAILQISPGDAQALVALKKSMSGDDGWAAGIAAKALWRFQRDETALKILVDNNRYNPIEGQFDCGNAWLDWMRIHAGQVDAVRDAINDPNARVRNLARAAMTEISPFWDE